MRQSKRQPQQDLILYNFPAQALWRAGLLAVCEDGLASCPLPATGQLMVGRSVLADLCIPAGTVSREHALITAGNPPLIEDLSSSNGSKIEGRRLGRTQQLPLPIGRIAELGDAYLILQEPYVALDLMRPKLQRFPATQPARPADDGSPSRLLALAGLLAATSFNVLLRGPSRVGTGWLAERMHQQSARNHRPLFEVDCRDSRRASFDVEFFGREATGGQPAEIGMLEAASGGNVVLDEVTELSLSQQARLAHALASGEVVRSLGVQPRPFDVRFIATSSADLPQLMSRGSFLWELYSQLAPICLTI